MALDKLESIYKQYMIGWSRYNFNGSSGCIIICVDDFDKESEDQSGSNATPVSAPYSESLTLEKVEMSLGEPAVIEFAGRLANRQGKSVLVATKILSVTPFNKPAAKPKGSLG